MNLEKPGLTGQLARCGLICAALCLYPASAKAASGTAIEARLLTPISSYAARPGMPLEALVTTPVCTTGEDLLPQDAFVVGRALQNQEITLRLRGDAARHRMP